MDEQVLDFDDIFDVWPPMWWERPWVWVALVCGLLILGVILYCVFQWYRSRVSKQDPREAALKRLYTVNPAVGLKEQHEFKHFYVEVLATIKEYLAQRHGYTSQGQTDYELLEYLKKHNNTNLFCPVVEQLVEHGLTIKFASLSGRVELVKKDYSAVLEAFSREVQLQKHTNFTRAP